METMTDYDYLMEVRDGFDRVRMESQAALDRALLILSPVMFTLSIVFTRSFTGDEMNDGLLLTAWAFWGLCVLLTIVSYRVAIAAHEYAIASIDNETLDRENPGGVFNLIVNRINALSIMSFVLGFVAFGVFVWGVVI